MATFSKRCVIENQNRNDEKFVYCGRDADQNELKRSHWLNHWKKLRLFEQFDKNRDAKECFRNM